jgi:hypothetical protein
MTKKLQPFEARSLAEEYIEKNIPPPDDDRLVIADAATMEVEGGWLFSYQSEKYLTTKDYDFFIVGNWPVFVSVDGGIVEIRITTQR